MNENLPRWIIASVAKALATRAEGVPLLIEGVGDIPPKGGWCELYLDGPSRAQYTRIWTKYFVTVLIGCQVRLDDQNVYEIRDLIGKMAVAVKDDIEILKLGDSKNPVNDGSYVGCLTLRDDVVRPIDGAPPGIVKQKGIDIRRATVEAWFWMKTTN